MPTLLRETSPLLEAVHMAAQKLSEAGDVDAVLKEVLQICMDAVGASGGTVYLHDPSTHKLRSLHVLPEDVSNKLQRLDIPDNHGVAGRVFHGHEAIISRFPRGGNPESRQIRERSGVTVRTMITLALQIHGMEPLGVIQLINKQTGEFNETDKTVLDTVCDVCALAVNHARLMDRRAQVASLESMGRTAHDLANKAGVLTTFLPDFERNLEALRGVLKIQGVRGEACLHLDMLESTFRDVFAPYSDRVYRYARMINDLAAGKQLEPKIQAMTLAKAVEDAIGYMQPQSRRSQVSLEMDLDYQAEEVDVDDLFVIRIAENLVGNAIKAVVERADGEERFVHVDSDETLGRVIVRTYAEGKNHVLAVEDEGVGIPPRKVRQIMEGQAASEWHKSSGSGLGTKVILELTKALNAEIQIRSKLGEGTTFKVIFPPKR
jgi:signal transduction histidine kinase